MIEKKEIFKEFIRFCIVGGIATLADMSILYLLAEIVKINYLVATMLGFMVGMVINYVLSIIWVFKYKHGSFAFIKFMIIGLCGLGINEICLWIGVSLIGIYVMYAKVVSTGIVLFWNYSARKIFIFNNGIKSELPISQ